VLVVHYTLLSFIFNCYEYVVWCGLDNNMQCMCTCVCVCVCSIAERDTASVCLCL